MKVIPEADLRALSREFGRLLPKTNSIGEQDLKTLEDLLQDLFASTEAAQLSLSHRAAACNALCGFVDTTSTSSILQVKLVSLNTSVCNRILSFYLDRFQDASFRSMKQILTTLSKLMVLYKNGTVGKGFDDWTEDASALSIRYISSSADFSCVKPSILLLEIILSKGLQQRERFFEILFLVQQDLLSRSKAVPVALDSDSNPDQGLQLFVIDILRWSRNSDLCLAGGRLLRILFSEHNHDTYQYNYSDDLFLKVKEPMWLQPVLDLVKDKSVDLEKIEKYILLELLAANKVNILYLARKLPIYRLLHGSSGGIQDSDIRLALLLVKVMEAAELSNSLRVYFESEIRIPIQGISTILAARCLEHQSPIVRIAATSIIVFADGTAASFTDENLQALRPVLATFFAETDAKIRGDLSNILKKLTSRLLLVINKLHRSSANARQDAVYNQRMLVFDDSILILHTQFVEWFYSFLCTEMLPSASYQRHLMALKTLTMESTLELLYTCKINPFTINMIRQLAEMVMDPFDDVRSLSASLLKASALGTGEFLYSDRLESYIMVAKNRMIRTGRANISDGYARLVELSYHFGSMQHELGTGIFFTPQAVLHDICEGLTLASLNLQMAVTTPQLHGQFSALRYIINHPQISNSFRDESDWRSFQDKLLGCCLQAWEVVKPILCIDSPEGQGDDEEVKDIDIGIKDTLSFSWRMLKESSSLIQAVISNTTYGFQGNRGLHYDDYKKLGDLAFVQLSQLRHRGAFSTVTQCFTTCCVECGRSADPKTTRLPSEWYMQTILTIDLKASVLTRRSAGLPAMMTAVLTSNPVGDFFDSAMKKLQNIASRPVFTAHEHGKTGLPQVHAMNCIKDIFSSTQLGSDAERHLESSLQVAVRSLNHDIWSIRNCGGMLLKAILNRLSSKSVGRNSEIHQHSARTTYGKYPILAVVIETLLNSSLSINHINLAQTTNRQVNNGLPALDIINCVGIRGDRQEAIRYLLHQLLGSPVWLLRQRVAITLSRAFGSRTFVDELLKTIRSDMLADSVQSNTLHGQMICIKNCLLDLSETGQKDVLIHMISLFDALMAFSCSFIISAYLELLIELIGNLLGSVLPGSDQNLFDVIRQLHVELKKYHRGADQNELHRLDAHVSTWIYCYTEGHSQEIIPDKLNVPAVVELLRKYPVTIPSLYGRYEMIRMVRNHVIPDEHNVKRDQFPCLSTIQYLIGILTSDPSRWKENVSLGLNSDNEQCEELNECTKEILMACKGLENKNQAWKCAMLELQFAIVSYTQQGLDETLWEIWSKTVHLAICDQLDFRVRYSAIKAICSVENLIHARLTNLNGPLQESDLIQILYSLLEALNDDDSEIRDLAASTVSHISWNGDGEFPPLVTSVKSQRLLFQYIKTLCIDQPDSLAYALARVLGLPKFASAPTGTPKVSLITPGEWIVMRPEPSLYLSLFEELGPTARSVEDALVDDDVLFGEERQNLYKDNVQEMEEWTGFLMTCQPPEQDWSRIYAWAFHGLEAIGKADGSSAWWSYQQEGFEAVCRVLMLARVAQSWSSDIDYLKILKDAVLKAELQLGLVHQEHAKIINILKSHFEDIE